MIVVDWWYRNVRVTVGLIINLLCESEKETHRSIASSFNLNPRRIGKEKDCSQSGLKCLGSLYHSIQCRSKGNITGGARERRRREPLGGSGGMVPQKILKARGLVMLFPAFSKSDMWFLHIANYLLRTLSQQTNVHWEYNIRNVNY